MVKPFPRSYWVIPGKLLAGTYPGDKDPAEARRMLQGMLECGIRYVVNLLGLLQKFWNFEPPQPVEGYHLAAPLLIYADLLATAMRR